MPDGSSEPYYLISRFFVVENKKFFRDRRAMDLRAASSKIKAQSKLGPAVAFQLSPFSFELRDDVGLRVRPALDT